MIILAVIRSVYFKAFMIFILLFLSVLSSWFYYTAFTASEDVPSVKLIDMEQRKEYQDFSVVVRTGIHISNFPTFDVQGDLFTAEGVIWFEYNPDEISPDLIEKFSLANGGIEQKSPPDIRLNEDGTMLQKHDVKIKFKSNMDYYHFPFDGHKISIQVINNYVTSGEMYYTAEDSGVLLDKKNIAGSWIINRATAAWGYADLVLDKNEGTVVSRPIVVYTLDVENQGWRLVTLIFLPMLFMLFLSLMTMILAVTNVSGRTQLAISSLGTLIGYRFVVEKVMPNVGYFTVVDFVYVIFLAAALLAYLFQAALDRYQYSFGGKWKPLFIEHAQIANDIYFLALWFLIVSSLSFVIYSGIVV